MLTKIINLLPTIVKLAKRTKKTNVKSLLSGAIIIVAALIASKYMTLEQISDTLDVAEQISDTLERIEVSDQDE